MALSSSTLGRWRPVTRLALASLSAAVAVVGLTGAPSAAEDASDLSPAQPFAELELSLTRVGPVIDGSADTVTLTCSPDGGTHPDPKAACDSLRAVNGVPERLPSTGDFCNLIYDPHVARATGHWGPTFFVDYEETFGNRCFAAVGTDNVFAF